MDVYTPFLSLRNSSPQHFWVLETSLMEDNLFMDQDGGAWFGECSGTLYLFCALFLNYHTL